MRESDALVHHIDNHGMPKIDRSITQLDALSRRLARKHPNLDAQEESQAQMFFATKGLDLSKHSRTLRNIDLSKTYESLEPLGELEVEKFLEHQHQMLINTAIEESSNVTASSFRKHYIRKMESDWEQAKQKLLETLGYSSALQNAFHDSVRPTSDAVDNGHNVSSSAAANASFNASVDASAAAGLTSTIADVRMARYAHTVKHLNDRRRQREPFRLATAFRDTAVDILRSHDDSERGSDVVDSWELLRCIVDERDVQHGDYDAAHGTEQQFRAQYVDPGRKLALVERLIRGARRYAESLYLSYISDVIEHHPTASGSKHHDGGTPSLQSRIRRFLSAKYNGRFPNYLRARFKHCPFWPQVFYCFRCGRLDAALKLAREGARNNLCSKIFVECLTQLQNAGADSTLPSKYWKEITHEYNDSVRNSPDPFQVAMYVLIARCDPNPRVATWKQEITPTSEDYLWVKLCLLWERREELPSFLNATPAIKDSSPTLVLAESCSLARLQSHLVGIGASHFNPDGTNPLLYFNVLMMSLQFEHAVAYLLNTDFFCEGVHFAIALDYYGLLHRAEVNQKALLSVAEDGRSLINFASIIQQYVEPFARVEAELAFHYLCTLRLRVLSEPTHASLPSTALPHLTDGPARLVGMNTPSRHSAGANNNSSSSSSQHHHALTSASAAATGAGRKSYAWEQADSEVQQLIEMQDELADDLFFASLVRLLLATKEFEVLAGSLRADDINPGCFFRYLSRSEAEAVIYKAAVVSSKRSNHEDAIILFALCRQLDKVAERLLDRLSRLVSAPLSNTDRARMVAMAQQFQQMRLDKLDRHKLMSLQMMLKLVQFFNLYRLGSAHYMAARETLDQLDLVPRQLDPVELERSANKFKSLHKSIQSTFVDVVAALMSLLLHQYEHVRDELNRSRAHSAGIVDRPRQGALLDIRQRARALLGFAGDIPVVIPTDVSAQLARMEARMRT
eukprot:TRINITY_DN67692_c3_g1_i3.p1 TRINITY_DN67692_c3_g1~~TRINITY_DN67692_c3_g1_i3.p1  ORF type:complete len:967 (+),score=523.67 TRINITY_DN67692_c3_g1_i3:2082-4982(+)